MKQTHQSSYCSLYTKKLSFKIWQSLVKVLLNNGIIIKFYLIGNRLLIWK